MLWWGEITAPEIHIPATVEIDFRTEGERVQRTGPRTATITDEDPLRLFRTFLAANSLTRPLAAVR